MCTLHLSLINLSNVKKNFRRESYVHCIAVLLFRECASAMERMPIGMISFLLLYVSIAYGDANLTTIH